MSHNDHRYREALDTFTARVRQDLDAHLRTLSFDISRLLHEREEDWRAETARKIADIREEIDRTALEARTEAEHNLRDHLGSLRAQPAGELKATGSARGGTADAQTKADKREGQVDALEMLLGAVRRIDEAGTLTGALEALARGAAACTARVAVLLVDGDLLRCWGHFGYAAGQTPFDVPVSSAGVLAAAVALRQTSFVPLHFESRDQGLPAFMRVPVGHTGLVAPIVIGGEVVAVIYADDVGRKPEQEDAPVWTEEVELLARHAALRLENLTSARTVEVLTPAD